MKKYLKLIFTILICLTLTLDLIPTGYDGRLIINEPVYAYAGNVLPLIHNKNSINYKKYIPKLKISNNVKKHLNIKNPSLSINAKSAILIRNDGKVLYHKHATSVVFPGSTAKLLSALVLLEWCKTDEKITVGSEIKLIASDSSKAGLRKGEKLKVSTLLAAMLLPSGNDAAYVAAAYVGKKSLKKSNAKAVTAVKEFVRLMNKKAKELGAENSCFVTPDGYDALGQYTTAYDMGRIALRAVKSKSIIYTTSRSSMSATILSGQRFYWTNTNQLIRKGGYWYNSSVIGLKTGTTSMAGKCLLSAAKSCKGKVISIVMNSTSQGRWSDSNKLLKYGLNKLK